MGATTAAAAFALFRPRPTNLFLWIHGLLLLAMPPFGYHLLPQNGWIRTLSGQLFAVGLVGYLSLLPGALWKLSRAQTGGAQRGYWICALVSVIFVQATMRIDSAAAAWALAWLGAAGLIVLAGLSAANLILAPWAVFCKVRSIRRGSTP